MIDEQKAREARADTHGERYKLRGYAEVVLARASYLKGAEEERAAMGPEVAHICDLLRTVNGQRDDLLEERDALAEKLRALQWAGAKLLIEKPVGVSAETHDAFVVALREAGE